MEGSQAGSLLRSRGGGAFKKDIVVRTDSLESPLTSRLLSGISRNVLPWDLIYIYPKKLLCRMAAEQIEIATLKL